jgi:NTP pyrophosphatase (non-canonical NTP hydrolase)
MTSLEGLQGQLRSFAAVREWEVFHTPKNLAMAVAAEAGELLGELQWLTDEQIQAELKPGGPLRGRVEGEIADVLLYLARLADVAGIDLLEAATTKLEINETRYPPDTARGTSEKYTRLSKE